MSLEDDNAALRHAVETRLAATRGETTVEMSPMVASLAGCKPAMEAATRAMSDGDPYSAWVPPDAERRAEAVAGFKRVVEDARPAREARTKVAEGTTAKFGTGAVRSDTVEAFRYDLVSPIGLREVARTCAEGAAKYDDFNWEKGMPVHDLLNHALAHIYGFLGGDRSEPHLGHAAWNLLAAIHSNELWPELNDGHLRRAGCKHPNEEFA